MKVTIQKTANVPDPVRAHSADAGLDLYVPEGQGCTVRQGAVHMIDLGIRVAIPDGYCGQLALRSSAGAKGLTIPHGAGIIDSGYRGNLKVSLSALADPVLIAAGERICQLIILPLPHVDAEAGVVDDRTDRGNGGFGSTGVDAVIRHHAPHPQKDAGPTIGQLIERLQDTARRCGNDTPVAALAAGGDHEQTDDTTHLTVNGLMRELREIASQYGNIPIVIPTTADADYEQATAPFIMHTKREPVSDDWDLFCINPHGEAVAVIS